jgi:O-antigen/teichoic acid export membrane protein
MSFAKRFTFNALIQVIGKFVVLFISLANVKLLTTFLGVEVFGQYTTIITYVIVLGMIADLGLNVILAREIAEHEEHEDAPEGARSHGAVSNIFTMRLAAVICVMLLGSAAVWLFPYTPQVKLLTMLAAFGMIFMSLVQVFHGVFQKHLRTDKVMIGDILSRMGLLAAIGVALAFNSLVLTWVIVGYVLSQMAQFAYIFWNIRKYYNVSLQTDMTYWRTTMRKALPMFVIITLNIVYFQIDKLMLSVMDSQTAVGYYGAAYKILEILVTFPGMFVGLLVPLMTKHYLYAPENFQNVIDKAFNILYSLAIPVGVGGIILAEPIVLLISGDDFLPSQWALKVLFVAVSFIFVSNMFGHILISTKYQDPSMAASILGAVANIVLNLFLIPMYSFIGAAIATVITEGLVFIAYLVLTFTFVKRTPRLNFLQVFKVMLATSFMTVSLLYTPQILPLPWDVFVQALIGGVVFTLTLFLFTGRDLLYKLYIIDRA